MFLFDFVDFGSRQKNGLKSHVLTVTSMTRTIVHMGANDLIPLYGAAGRGGLLLSRDDRIAVSSRLAELLSDQ